MKAFPRIFIIVTTIVALSVSLMMPAACLAQNDEDGVFLIGLIPEENIFRQIKKHKPLEEYLSEKLGMKVKFTILSRYPDIIDRFSSRGLDGAFFGIFTALLAHENLGVVPVARPMNIDGSTTARSCIFVRKDSLIKGPGDMKDKRAAFVDMATATGYIYGVAYLREHGVKNPREFFKESFFTGSHDTAVYTVVSGRADVGVVKCRILEKMQVKDPMIVDEITVLSKSMELPDNTLFISKRFPPEFQAKLRDILLSMHEDPKGREVLESLEATKFVGASWDEMKAVRELADQAGIDVGNFQYR